METTEQLSNGQPINERVGFWTRLGAYLIDVLFVMIFGITVGMIIGADLAPVFFPDQLAQFEQFNNYGADFDRIFPNFYELMVKMMEIAAGTTLVGFVLIILEGSTGQSIGKMALKIKNTNEDGSPALPQTLWIRALCKYGASLLSLLGGMSGLFIISILGSIWSLVIFVGFFLVFMDKRQTIHDMIAKTVVSRLKR
jgi:uncharacterized RDD family membrane protein YckC